nr:aldehyde dehydrogenase [Paenibacillus turpanensis]
MEPTIPSVLERQRQFLAGGAAREISYRRRALERLAEAVRRHEAAIIEAMRQDFRKPEFETYATEIGFLLSEIRHALKHLDEWSRPVKVKTPVTHFGSASYIHSEPFGVVLVIAPWNYPVNLSLGPVIGAIAAGNCVVLKPSELTPHTSEVVAELCRDAFEPEHVCVVQGDAETSQALLRERFDYIFFTGSTRIGQLVMEAAAKQLTPVTLELGGKSPCLVHGDAQLELSAKRIAWGKFLNAGQTCVAPDYLFVQRGVKPKLLEALARHAAELYGADVLRDGSRFAGIVSEGHYARLTGLLAATRGRIVYGGSGDAEARVLAPTIVDEVGWDDPLMEDELFGPILPVVVYDELEEALAMIRSRPKPLALYVFTESDAVQRRVTDTVSFGGGCVNDTIMHIASPYLPFGGVGASGIGSYHGKASFDLFSHRKSVLRQTSRFDIPFRYPNAKNALQWMKRFLK